MSGHKFVLNIEDGCTSWSLLCPEDGSCTPAISCGACGRSFEDTEVPRCYDCPTERQDGCWAQSWVGELMVDEVLHGEVTLDIPVRCEHNGDGFEAHIEGPVQVRAAVTDGC